MFIFPSILAFPPPIVGFDTSELMDFGMTAEDVAEENIGSNEDGFTISFDRSGKVSLLPKMSLLPAAEFKSYSVFNKVLLSVFVVPRLKVENGF